MEELKMVKVFDREEFVQEVFEMEAEYLERFGLKDICQDIEDIKLDIWFGSVI